MQTGENEQALRKIMDFTRYLGILVLILHFYFSCYGAFVQMHLTYPILDQYCQKHLFGRIYPNMGTLFL
jgi:hypothetical protein